MYVFIEKEFNDYFYITEYNKLYTTKNYKKKAIYRHLNNGI